MTYWMPNKILSYLILSYLIMMLYISAMEYARMLKFSSHVHLPSINKMFQYRYAWLILCSVGKVNIIIFGHRCYISALEHVRMLILS